MPVTYGREGNVGWAEVVAIVRGVVEGWWEEREGGNGFAGDEMDAVVLAFLKG